MVGKRGFGDTDLGASGTVLPKRVLVNLILSHVPAETVRGYFNMRPTTDLSERLESFTKSELVRFIQTTGDPVLARMYETEQEYPLSSAPSAFLLCIEQNPGVDVFVRLSELYSKGRRAAKLWDNQVVRAVYVCSKPVETRTDPSLFMFQLAYEIAVKYVNADADSPDFGEIMTVYSLERAIVLYPKDHLKHALVYCSHFQALRYLQAFLREYVQLTVYSPNLTEEMMNDISSGASPRTATFRRMQRVGSEDCDVDTIMVADQGLSSSNLFRSLKGDKHREQNAGFYTGHPGVLRGGLGISRRYGRLWTPARLTVNELVELGVNVLLRVEKQVNSLTDNARVAYYRNMPITIGGHLLKGSARRAFDLLVEAVADSIRERREYQLEREDQITLFRNRKNLKLTAAFSFECGVCHLNQIAHCPQCGRVLSPEFKDGKISAECSCGNRADVLFGCDCGHSEEISDLWVHLLMWPEPEIICELGRILSYVGISLRSVFYIDGGILRVVPAKHSSTKTVLRIDDLGLWCTRARIAYQDVSAEEDLLYEIIRKSKEKCDPWPDRQKCENCLASTPGWKKLVAGKLCLPRIFGIPIHEKFDGIHTGSERADLRYNDRVGDTTVYVGIHVKSYNRGKTRLTRGNSRVKSLYAQYCYSVFQTAIGKWSFDVIGVATPQDLEQSVCKSLAFFAEKSGIPLLLLQQYDWLRIAAAALETVRFDSASE